MVKLKGGKNDDIFVAVALGLFSVVFCKGRNVHRNVVGEHLINLCFEFVSESSHHILDSKSNTHTGMSQIQSHTTHISNEI